MIGERELSLASLHVHTRVSDGLKTPAECVCLAEKAGVQVLAVTDHDRISGAKEAQRYARETNSPVEVVLGSEISTAQGHLLALFLPENTEEKDLAILESLDKNVREIHQMGGVTIIPHLAVGIPLVSVFPTTLMRLYENGQFVDGIETDNLIFRLRQKRQAEDLRDSYKLSAIGADDDHNGNLGKLVVTVFPGKTSQDLKKAIEKRETLVLRRNGFESSPSSIFQTMEQLYRALISGLPNVKKVPVLVSTLIDLQAENRKCRIKANE